MNFDLSNPQRYVSFCTHSSITASSFDISLQLGGDNAASYTLSTTKTTITVLSSPSLNQIPTFTLTVANAQKTYANFQLLTNIPGLCFYHIRLSPLATPLSVGVIKRYIKSNTLILSSNNDYLTTKIYSEDRYERVGYSSILIAGNNFFSVEDLLPQRSYTICAYFESQFGLIADHKCITFTTQSWGTVRKSTITFTAPILANQLNNLLCYMVKASNSKINQIIDEEGRSCSLLTSPVNYYYNYKGNTTGNSYTRTVIYHIANPNITTDGSMSAFTALFDTTGLTTISKAAAQT